MRVFITGGTGLIGSLLAPTLLGMGHGVTVLTRDVNRARGVLGEAVEYCASLETLDSLDGFHAVVNLAGEPVQGKRWTTRQKELILQSRLCITRKLVQLMRAGDNPPKVLVSGSAVGFYGRQGDNVLTESGQPHEGFTYLLCKQWEEAALQADSWNTRTCIIRTGIVLSAHGGLLGELLPLFRLGLGAVLGSGKQYISWVHRQDLVNIIIFLILTSEARGVFNATAPEPVPHKRFCDSLAAAYHRPRFLRLPSLLIRLLVGEGADLILHGQQVVPRHLQRMGYAFVFGELESALQNIASGDEDKASGPTFPETFSKML